MPMSTRSAAHEASLLAFESVRAHPARSALAIVGIVIGIVTVVLVASVLAGLRDSVALLFRELGTENVFAFHRNGDPYTPLSDEDARRLPLEPAYATALARLGPHIRDVGVQILVPNLVNGRALTARAAGNESDTVIVQGNSANYFDITGAEFAEGRPFTDLEDRVGARVAVLGANVATALYGTTRAVGRSLVLGGDRYFVVGVNAPRRGSFFGENRNDNVVSIPVGTARRRYPEADLTVLYIRATAGHRPEAFQEAETILRLLREVPPGAPNDFQLSTADQIIAQFDRLSAQIGLATIALAFVSLVIGGIGIANVMVISVTERTREIGVRLAIGAPRREVRRQFLFEAALLSVAGGAAGVLLASTVGLALTRLAPAFPAVPPAWAILGGLSASLVVGITAGYLPARRAAALDPVEALRYE